MRALNTPDRARGGESWASATPREESPIRAEITPEPSTANFEGFWKLPAGMLAVERGGGRTAVSLTRGDGTPTTVPPSGLPSLTPVGITAPDMALVDGRVVMSFDLYEAMRRFYYESFAVARQPCHGRHRWPAGSTTSPDRQSHAASSSHCVAA